MKEIFEKMFKIGIEEFIKAYNRVPEKDEVETIRAMARIATAIYMIEQEA